MLRRNLAIVAMAGAAMAVSARAGLINTVVDNTPGGATVDATVNGGEYVGTVSGGGTGFGGPVGGATMSVDSDANGIYIGLSSLGDYTGNSIRVYFDTKSGGYSELSDSSGFNDFGDFGRERLSRPASNGLTLPFAADYGWIISPAFTGFQAMFELTPGGNDSLDYAGLGVNTTSVGESPTNSTFEAFIPYANLGMTAGANVDFVLIYSNNNDQDNAFMSDEGFPFQTAGNPGNGPVTLANFHRLTTVPEPASVGLLGIAAAALLRRKGSR